ncbi:hypothetical protein [Arenibaculum pallidiluteum]|uniref:hypothetical protein n=1 Tax=Arenibaculum pallidiluteum TaxID=2812559 RepID=UPI001A957CD3|nr:hypothetical protein [Arenibaculum pallidiluteum]
MRASPLIRATLALCAGLLLAGCSDAVAPLPAVTAADIGVLIATDKTITDHAVSYYRDQDCRTTTYLETGRYCQPYPEPVTVTREAIYCYRTLADVECYPAPNPYGGRAQPVTSTFSREVVRRASEEPGPSAGRASFR